VKPRLRRNEALRFVLRGLRLLRQHYLTLVSASVLAALAVIVLTSDSFESRDAGSTPKTAAVDEAASPIVPPPHRPIVLFYVVNDAAQRDEIAAAVHADRDAFGAGGPPIDTIVYLIAGTKQEESRTIERLNFEEIAAELSGVEMRVIDVRGRFD
jgi:hypothetical protein